MSLISGDQRQVPISRIIAAGFAAPLKHFRGLATCSALWLVISFLFELEVSSNRVWMTDNDGDVVWRYSFSAYGAVLFGLEIITLASFFLGWSRGVYFNKVADEAGVLRIERRLWWMLRDGTKLFLGLIVICIVVLIVVWVVQGISSVFGLGAVASAIIGIAALAGIVTLSCRLSTFFTAIAVNEEPRDVVDAADHTKGHVTRILVALLPIYLLKKVLDLCFFGIGTSISLGERTNFRITGGPIFGAVGPEEAVPIWIVVAGTLVAWLYYAVLFATLAELYRRLWPEALKDQPTIEMF